MVRTSTAQRGALTQQDGRGHHRWHDHHVDRRCHLVALDEPVDKNARRGSRGGPRDRRAARRPFRIDGEANLGSEGPRSSAAGTRRTPRSHRRTLVRAANDVLPPPRSQTELTMSPSRRSVALLGATGSIGVQTLDVLRQERARFELVAIAGGEQLSELAAIAAEFNVKYVGVKSEHHRSVLADLLSSDVAIVVGDEGLMSLAQSADVVVNAVMGFAGLPVTLGALAAGKRLALANKESFIAAAPLVAMVRHTDGAALLPIDSEHCAVHQCLASSPGAAGYPDVKRIVLTASGGPFRGWNEEQLKGATKEDALHHPTWSMGAKITIDSSTLMNKGLEVLEASALFGIEVDRIDVVVHPQSIVHSMVEYVDGSVLAQLSRPDMRLPIAYCLG